MNFLTKILRRPDVDRELDSSGVSRLDAKPAALEYVDTFAGRLRLLVDQTARSQAAFARALDVGDTTLANYMSGRTEPTVSKILKICEFTGVDLVWLMTGKGSMRGGA